MVQKTIGTLSGEDGAFELKEHSALNGIRKELKDWRKETLFVEINFWKEKEVALIHTYGEDKLNSDAVVASTMVLCPNNFTNAKKNLIHKIKCYHHSHLQVYMIQIIFKKLLVQLVKYSNMWM